MSLTKFEIFLKTVEMGNLSRAAEALNITQSGVSHAIRSLELEYGFQLLSRNKTGIRLTENGDRILTHVREIVNHNERLKQAVAEINGIEAGTLRIGTFTSVSTHWLPAIIHRFHLEHPRIEIKLMEGDYGTIETWIQQGVIDLGFMSLPSSSHLESIPLRKDRMLCVLPKDHPLSKQSTIRYAQLEKVPFIMPASSCGYDVRRVLEAARVHLNIQFETGDDHVIVAMVENGLGISVMSELALQGQSENVTIVELEDRPTRSLGLSLTSIKHALPAAKRFIEHTQKWLDGE
ncbi:LysR substrate-binding domain-containing protein [Bacillus cereus]|uniref:LysR family transcriptional regulator n=1 Tax=Bacillus TaxID=1386 RepID=UPI001F5635A9|nr:MULTISPECIES: LysR family transcriptional regulator [Bacillus cereus group]MCU4989021.1 LysR substrate-binding domain-containing protein [Bacillus cereus]USL14531.1 LysR family transcriptional regulator [Bacillus thuringiensis]